MKQIIKQSLLLAVLTLVIFGLTFAVGTKKTLPYNSGSLESHVSFTAVDASIDTVVYRVEPGIATLTFFVYNPDSASFDRVSLRRISNAAGGTTAAVVLATVDTLSYWTALNVNAVAAGAASVTFQAVTLAPLADQIWFIVDRASANTGVTSTTAYYGVIKTYNK
jgi:hypothetical protein